MEAAKRRKNNHYIDYLAYHFWLCLSTSFDAELIEERLVYPGTFEGTKRKAKQYLEEFASPEEKELYQKEMVLYKANVKRLRKEIGKRNYYKI